MPGTSPRSVSERAISHAPNANASFQGYFWRGRTIWWCRGISNVDERRTYAHAWQPSGLRSLREEVEDCRPVSYVRFVLISCSCAREDVEVDPCLSLACIAYSYYSTRGSPAGIRLSHSNPPACRLSFSCYHEISHTRWCAILTCRTWPVLDTHGRRHGWCLQQRRNVKATLTGVTRCVALCFYFNVLPRVLSVCPPYLVFL